MAFSLFGLMILMRTIDGPDHNWKVRNIIKLSLCISQVFWEWQELCSLFRNSL